MFAKKRRSAPLVEDKTARRMRLFCILQLCLAFSLICWHVGYPFLGRVYEFKKELSLYQHVVEDARFSSLPPLLKERIESRYLALKKSEDKPLSVKMIEGIRRFFSTVPPLESFWLFLSVLLPILALKRRNGIEVVIWLLPAVALAYAIENSVWGVEEKPSADVVLFPTEQELAAKYMVGEMPESIMEQKKVWENAWNSYLADVWGNGDKEAGLFSFTVARLEKKMDETKQVSNVRESGWLLFLYVLWNGIVAWSVWREARRRD